MKINFKALFVASSLLVAGSASLNAQDVTSGMKYLDAEQFTKAKETFTGLVSAGPTLDNQFYLGYYYLRVAQNALHNEKDAQAKAAGNEAKSVFEKIIAADPKFALSYVGLGGVALLNKDLGEAKTQINKALELSKSKDEKVLYRSAEMYTFFKEESAANDPAEAVRLIDLISTLKKKTDDPEYYVVKGDAFRLKGANEGGPAVSEYEKAIYIKNMARVHERIGKIFKAGKNYKEAQVSFNRAIEADSMFAPVYRSRGEMWLLARNYKNAAYNYKKYIDALQAGDARDVTPEVWLRYAKFAFLSKDLDGASKAMEKVQGISDTDIPRMKGYIANTKGNHEEAIKQLEELIAQLPEKKKLTQDYGTLGRSYAALKKSDEALANLAKAVADTNENYNMDIYNVIYQDKKNYKNAAEAYTKVIDWKQKQEEKVGTNDYLRLGMAYYFATSEAKKAKDSLAVLDLAPKADSAFSKIVQTNTSYKPAYLWRARTNLLLDSDHSKGGLSIPFYDKFIVEGDKEKNKKEVVEACKVVGGYYLLNKDDVKAMEYFKKGFELMPDDAVLKERVLGPATPPATTTPAPPATPVKKN